MTGGQEVAGSNPIIQTNKKMAQSTLSVGFFAFGQHMGNTATSPHAGQERPRTALMIWVLTRQRSHATFMEPHANACVT